MANNELKNIIDTQLFVPIDYETVSQLHGTAEQMADTVELSMVENLMLGFLKRCVVSSFKQSFIEKHKKLYGKNPNIPTVIFIVLELYVVRLAILSENVSDNVKEQISLIAKNSSVLKRGKWQGVMCQEWLLDIFSYNKSHKWQTVTSKSYKELVRAVLPARKWAETGLDLSLQDVYYQLHSLCVDGMIGKVNAYVNSKDFMALNSPFAQTYIIVKKLIKDWQWKYVEQSPVNKLYDVLGKNAKKRKNLSNITSDIKSCLQTPQLLRPAMKSSILMKKIFEGSASGIDDMMFTAIEFGVYLYYEMLLETYND